MLVGGKMNSAEIRCGLNLRWNARVVIRSVSPIVRLALCPLGGFLASGGGYTRVFRLVLYVFVKVYPFSFFLGGFHSHSKPISSPTPAFDSSRRLLPYFSATFRLLFSSWSCREGWIATSKMRKKWSCKRGVEKRGAGRGCKFGLEY